ncbi:MAG TPA: FxsC protein [Polyangiaceae bacterium]
MAEPFRCWYFLSYARGDQNNPPPEQDLVLKFDEALSAALASDPQDDLDGLGFRDRHAIDVGTDWKEKLLAALSGCRTFIPLMSQNYFTREVCGQEWAAFENRAEGKPLILPLIWYETPGKKFPSFAQALNHDFAQGDRPEEELKKLHEYKQYGLRRLLKDAPNDSRMQAVLNAVVAAVAYKIVERANESPLVVPSRTILALPAAKFGAKASAAGTNDGQTGIHVGVAAGTNFEMGPRRAQHTKYYPSDSARDWAPYAPIDKSTISQFVIEAAQGRPCRWLDVRDPQLVQRIRELEKPGQDSPVLLLIDPWSADIPELTQALAPIDEQRFRNCTVLIVWNYEAGGAQLGATERLGIQTMVRRVFVRSYPTNATETSRDFIANINDAATLRRVLETCVRDLTQLAATTRAAARPVPEGSNLITVRAQ